MRYHLYCMAYPMEALVASMLSPEEFGRYMAVGTKEMARGRVVFMAVDQGSVGSAFDLERAARYCVPRPDGTPKQSHYLAIYRVLENLPLAAFKELYLAT